MDHKVSVIVPVYNCEKYLPKCLESILDQTYKNIEIVIVNDGSIDGSEKIALHYKEKDKRISYYYQNNSGPSVARNKGIFNSTGEYLVFVDSDDTVENYYIEYLLKKMLSSDYDLVCSGYKDISEFGLLKRTDFNFENSITLHEFIETVCRGTGGVLWGKIYKKEIIIKHNIMMDKKIFMCEDLIFVLQYAVKCQSFAAINEYLYNYNRLNQNSISSNISIKYIHNYIAVCEYIERIFGTLNFDEQKLNEIIVNRIQNVVIQLVEQQSSNIKTIGLKRAKNNIVHILSLKYIMSYKNQFSSDFGIYRPYIFFLKNDLIRASVIYGVYLNILRRVKKKFYKRKQVSL